MFRITSATAPGTSTTGTAAGRSGAGPETPEAAAQVNARLSANAPTIFAFTPLMVGELRQRFLDYDVEKDTERRRVPLLIAREDYLGSPRLGLGLLPELIQAAVSEWAGVVFSLLLDIPQPLKQST